MSAVGVGAKPVATGFHADWHQDEYHSDLGRTRQDSTPDAADQWGITFDHETPFLIRRGITEARLEHVLPTDQSSPLTVIL